MNEKSWREIVKKARQYKALGQIDHYLSGKNEGDYPWDIADKVETGGSHRLDISTSLWFSGTHKSGLRFRWSFDVEPYSANGKGYYEIDVVAIRRVRKLLPKACLKAFDSYLLDCATKVGEKAKEYQQIADREYSTAKILQELAQ